MAQHPKLNATRLLTKMGHHQKVLESNSSENKAKLQRTLELKNSSYPEEKLPYQPKTRNSLLHSAPTWMPTPTSEPSVKKAKANFNGREIFPKTLWTALLAWPTPTSTQILARSSTTFTLPDTICSRICRKVITKREPNIALLPRL